MAVHVWPQELEPEFPLAVVEYTASDDRDPMHWHDHLEIALVLDGHGAFLFGRRSVPARTGDVFFVDDSQPHVAHADPGSALSLLLVLFRPELIASPGGRELDAGYLAPFRAQETSWYRVRGTSELAHEIGPLLRDLGRVCARRDPAERFLADATLRLALALVNRHPVGTGAPIAVRTPSAATDRRQQIRPVLAFVDRHCREGIRLDDVAAVAHVSPSRIRHVFKDVTGVSFKEYLTHIRVAEAKRLLLGTDLPVAEVAGTVGYTNLHQFYKVFRRTCSMSPGEYRRWYGPGDHAVGAGRAG